MPFFMKYEEYRLRLKGSELERKLGVLGETHIYRPEETDLAREIVSKYDTVAREGSNKKNLRQLLLGVSLLPIYLLGIPYFKRYKRSIKNLDAKRIAEEQNKKIVMYEDTSLINLPQTLTLAAIPLLALAAMPFAIPYELIRSVFRKNDQPRTKGFFDRLFEKITRYATALDKRDKHMATKTIDYYLSSNTPNILSSCGKKHMNGIVKFIQEDPRVESLTKIAQREPAYNESIAPVTEPVLEIA